MALTLLAAVITVILTGLTSITALNVFTMLRLGRAPQADEEPRLSVLIPARNEARVIGETVRALLGQSYANFELILLDDNSTDGTADVARTAAAGDDRLRIISGSPLPAGWAGKNWACHQLSQNATGEYLVFTDADVQWGDGALPALVNELARTDADMLTIWSTQRTETWGERLCVPLMAFVILGYLPHLAVNHIRHRAFAAANGQCLTLHRSAYDAIGGHAAVRNDIVEDIRMAQIAKDKGLRLRMVDGNGLVTCRMYTNWPEVRNGYAKNITAGYGDSLVGLLAGSVFHWTVFLFPPLWLLVSLFAGNAQHILYSGILTAIGMLIRALTAAATRQRVVDALLLPLSVVLMTVIAAQSAYWYLRYGGPRWKGRTIIRRKRSLNHG
jgi:chlorobactene glucosyltransferase